MEILILIIIIALILRESFQWAVELGRKIENLILIIGVVLTVLQAMLKGHIKSVNIAGFIILASTFLIAFGGRNLFVRLIVKLIALAISLYFFAKEHGLIKNQKDLMAVAFSLLSLFIMLYGFFIMFRGVFFQKKR